MQAYVISIVGQSATVYNRDGEIRLNGVYVWYPSPKSGIEPIKPYITQRRIGKTSGSGPYLSSKGHPELSEEYLTTTVVNGREYLQYGHCSGYATRGGNLGIDLVSQGQYVTANYAGRRNKNYIVCYSETKQLVYENGKLLYKHERFANEKWYPEDEPFLDGLSAGAYARLGSVSRSTSEFTSNSIEMDYYGPTYFIDFVNEIGARNEEAWTIYATFDFLPGWINRGFMTAYSASLEEFPAILSGALANVLELAELLKKLWNRDFRSIGEVITDLSNKNVRQHVSDAWLTNRYAISTTSMDISEYLELFDRFNSLDSMKPIQLYGSFTDEKYTFSVTYLLDPKDWFPDEFWKQLRAVGLSFKTADLWDIIPFSFMFDWFLPISDILGTLDNLALGNSLTPRGIWGSVYDAEYETYMRFPVPAFSGIPYLNIEKDSSGVTWLKRLADTVSIFIL